MHKQKRTLALALVLFGALAAAPAVYAGESHGSHGSMMGRGMMGGHGMGMMNQMSRMMDQCGAMMRGNERPNDQWRRNPPSGQEKKD